MATLRITADALEVGFSTTERIFGILRDRSIPLSAVTGVEVVADGLSAPRGMRAPGLGMPGSRKIGHWRGKGHELVSVRRGQPALRIELEGQRYAALVIGADDAEAIAAGLREHAAG